MKLVVIGILCLAVAACTPAPSISIPIPGPKDSPRLASELAKAAPVTPREGAGAILIVRDKTKVFRKKCTYEIALDGQPMAGLRNGEQVTLYADPGRRSIVVSIRPEESCDAVVAEVPVKVVASATTKIRIVADVSYDLHIESTTY